MIRLVLLFLLGASPGFEGISVDTDAFWPGSHEGDLTSIQKAIYSIEGGSKNLRKISWAVKRGGRVSATVTKVFRLPLIS